MPFSNTNPPKRGGAYSRFIVKRRETLPQSTTGVLAMPITHDWGPFKTFVEVSSLAEFNQIFGEGVGGSASPTPGYLAVYNAFKGEGPNRPGASRIVLYRTGASSAAKATVNLNNTTPAPAITLTAKYEGTRGNNLDIVVVATPADPTNKLDLVITEDGVEYERFTFAKTNITDLVAQINAGSDWVTATQLITGVALATTAGTPLAAGADGGTLIAGDWTALMSAYESQRFEAFVPFNLTDTTIMDSLQAWAEGLNTRERSKRFTLVVGGGLNETSTTALARAAGYDDCNTATIGIGSYKDTQINATMSTSQLAPRIAGIIVARGISAAISFAHLADLQIVVGPTDTEILSCIDTAAGKGGVICLGQDAGGVRIEKGLTTRVSNTADQPKETYSKIKYVFTMQSFERTLQERWETGEILGQLEVNNDTREFLVSDARSLLEDYIKVGAVQKGASVGVSSDPPPSDDDEFVALDWVAKFGRTLDQVRSTFYMS